MGESNRESIIDRIRAILSKTESRGASEAEAATALEMAQRLLIKHNLDMAEIVDIQTDDDPVTEETLFGTVGAKGWRASLANVIGKAMFVKIITQGQRAISFIGRPENVGSVMEMYQWVAPQLEVMAGEMVAQYPNRWGRRSYATAVRHGMVSTISDRLQETMREQQAQTVGVTALVVQYDAENETFAKENHNLVTHRVSIAPKGYNDGKIAGREVSLTPGSRQIGVT